MNDNNNNVWNDINENGLIFMHGQFFETIHKTKYTATTNQSITSDQHFTTKPNLSKLLKISDESWEPTEKSSDTHTVSKSPEILSACQHW